MRKPKEVENGKFLEHVKYTDKRYGTHKDIVEALRLESKVFLLRSSFNKPLPFDISNEPNQSTIFLNFEGFSINGVCLVLIFLN